MSTTPICQISETGIFKPPFVDVLSYYTTAYRNIYGQDIFLDVSTPDAQFLALLASSVDDANAECVAVYNSFSPATATGVGLSSVVKINGIKRAVPSYSTAVMRLIGQVGVQISRGSVQDDQQNWWDLPELIVIPVEGELEVTAKAQELGAIRAPAGVINKIVTPVPGWQSAVNISDATPGAPIELDALLRLRQSSSATLPASSSFESLMAAIAALPDVIRYRGYNNTHASTDALGIEGHSVALVVEGGDIQQIADTTVLKKGSGAGTFGALNVTSSPDKYGVRRVIYFSAPISVPISFQLNVKPLLGYTKDIENRIKSSLADFTISVGIGNDVLLADSYQAARLFGAPDSQTYRIVPDTLLVARDGNAVAATDIAIAYNEAPYCQSDYVTIRLVP